MLRVYLFHILIDSSLDPALKEDLILLLQALLGDKVPSVLSCALSAWIYICPERTDLLHQSYRQICRMLIEMDEWGQLVAMRALSIYVRRCFERPVETNNMEHNAAEHFYDDNSENISSLDRDLLLLYKCALQLIHSRSSAVCLYLNCTYIGHHRTHQVISRFSASNLSPSFNTKSYSSITNPFPVNIIPRPLKYSRHRLSKSSTLHSSLTNNRLYSLPISNYSTSNQPIKHILPS